MGTEVLTLGLARGLMSKGHTVEVLAGHPEYDLSHKHAPWITTDQYEDITVHRLHFGLSKWKANRYLAIHEPKRISLIKTLVNRFKPDIVHFNHLIGFTSEIIPEIRGMNIPVLFTPTDFWTICPRFTMYNACTRGVCINKDDPVDCLQCLKPMPRPLTRLLYQVSQGSLRKMHWKIDSINLLTNRTKTTMYHINQSNRMFLSTQFLKDVLVKHGANEALINVIPYGVNLETLPDPLPVPKIFCNEEPLRLGYIGTLSDYKSPHTIVGAISYLNKKKDCVSVSLYGSFIKNDPYPKRLLKMIREQGSIARLKGTFPNERIGNILQSFHVLIIPSTWYESSPLVLISALNAGLPVIVSDLGGLTEALEGGKYGLIYPPGDSQALARIILNILENPDSLQKLRKNLSDFKRSVADYTNDVEKHYYASLKKE
jgi:glycosyltransferase involved in cell wall biosynthesis